MKTFIVREGEMVVVAGLQTGEDFYRDSLNYVVSINQEELQEIGRAPAELGMVNYEGQFPALSVPVNELARALLALAWKVERIAHTEISARMCITYADGDPDG